MCLTGLNSSGNISQCHRNPPCPVQRGTTGSWAVCEAAWNPQRCSAHKPALNTFLGVFECHSTPGLICGTQRVPACSAMLPPLAFTHFSTKLQEVLLQFHDLLLNRLSLVLTHDNPSQPGNAGCITAHVNAKSALIQKHQKKELGVNLT